MTRYEFLSFAAPRILEDWPDIGFKALFRICQHLTKAGFTPGAMSAGATHRDEITVGRHVRSTVRDPVLGEFDISLSLILDATRGAGVVLAASRTDSTSLTSVETFADILAQPFAAVDMGRLFKSWSKLTPSDASATVTAWLERVFSDEFDRRFAAAWGDLGKALERERAP